MCLGTLLFRSVARQMKAMAVHPTATVTTILHSSHLLPRDLSVDLQRRRLIRHELLHHHNFLFKIIVNVLACFW
ncbi:hypothetical protein QVD17_39110 [Tagetes erecta]|uniref:Uncharacterized protein n=1 Tax=Tagetes erecta TaxID=13708 RepID=A0AAD8NEV7_TARER|nr:hypothetical protein QVD17_39110 [Tagetes erecta]